MAVFYIINAVIGGFSWFGNTAGPAGIAIIHTAFNVITTILWLPFNKLLVKLASMTIRGNDEEDGSRYLQELGMLDERFLEKPSFAVVQAINVVNRMAELSGECMKKSAEAFLSHYDRKKIDSVIALEGAVDKYEDALGSYLVKLSGKPLNQTESERVTSIFQCITSFERITDHARNIAELKENVKEKDIKFSDKAVQEITNYLTAVNDIVDMTVDIFKRHDDEAAKNVEPFEEAIDIMDAKYKKHHIKRLQKGKCQIASSMIIDDLYINLERISDHCSNVAATMIQVDEEDALDNHVYVDNLKAENSPEFREAVKEYTRKYSI
jgi:phosphate:Na+ symporter